MSKWIVATVLTAAFSVGAFSFGSSQDTPAQNKKLCQRFMEEVINKGTLETIDELLAPTFVSHCRAPADYPKGGIERLKRGFTDLRSAFPDLKAELGDMVAEGDLVAIRSTWSGTQKGPFMDSPATGRKVSFEVIDFIRISKGRVTEHWGQMDTKAMTGSVARPILASFPPPHAK